MRLVRLLKYVLVGVASLYLLAAVLYAVPVISGVLDDTMGSGSAVLIPRLARTATD